MTTRTVKLALASSVIPFVSTELPRAVVSPDLDAAGRVPRFFFGAEASLDFNTPQVLYAENVVPVAEGWRSVRYEPAVNGPAVEVPAGSYPSAGYQSYQELRASDPEGTATFAPTPTTPLLTDTELGALVVQRTDSVVKLFMRFAASYSGSYSTVWRPVAVETQGATQTTFTAVNTLPGMTYAYVQGAQFICLPGYGIVFAGASTVGVVTKFRFLLQVCTADDTRVPVAGATNGSLVANVPFKFAAISCIGSSSGYLLIASENQIAWAVFDGVRFDFADFANNEVTGSGARIPEDLVGDITAIVTLSSGYILFSARNAVAAHYNSSGGDNPWVFRRIAGAGGVRNKDYVTVLEDSGSVYAYTSAGLQLISLQGAKDLEPAAADFLMGRKQETWSADTKLFSSVTLAQSYYAKVRFIGSRYLVISYGASDANLFQYLLVFDSALRRWGKLKYTHADSFDYLPVAVTMPVTVGSLAGVTVASLATRTLSSFLVDTSQQITRGRQMLALLTGSGAIVYVVLDNRDSADTTTSGVLVLGKVQLARSRWTILHRVELEGTENGCTVTIQPSVDGRSPHRNVSYTMTSSAADYQEFAGLEVGVNHNIIIEGQFDLSTVLVELEPEGKI